MDFQTTENSVRGSAYQKSKSDEESIQELNEVLKRFEQEQELNSEQFPWIFVTGLPRSGTTLVMQCLSTAFDFCYVNNFMARLWDAPIVAARMSKILLGKDRVISDFRSDHGKTEKLQGPHEWSYFWIDRLKYDRSNEYDRGKNIENINWDALKSTLDQMTNIFQKPFLNKALHPVKYVESFQKMNSNILFIHVQRDFLENCESIKEAREKYFGDANTWWSIIPDNYREIEKLPYHRQIPEQLHALDSEMKKDLSHINVQNVIYVRYKDLCDAPHKILLAIRDKIQHALNSDFGFDLENIPSQFSRKERGNFDDKMTAYIQDKFPEMI